MSRTDYDEQDDAQREVRRQELLGRIVSGDRLDAMDFPPLEWIVPGVIAEGYGVLVGAPKIGKSWLVLDLALAVSTGGTALGCIPVQQRPVLYLAYEDGLRRLQSRARALLGEGAPLPADLHVSVDYHGGGIGEVQEVTGAWLSVYGPDRPLIFVDTLGKVTPPDGAGNAYARDYAAGSQLKRIADTYRGSALIVVHHQRKAKGEDWMDSTSGTNGINGAADYTVALSAQRDASEGVLHVTGRDVKEQELGVQRSVDGTGTWRLAGGSAQAATTQAKAIAARTGLGDRNAQVVAYLAEHGPSRPKEIADGLGIQGFDNKAVGTALSYLSSDTAGRRVVKPTRGVYALAEPTLPVGTESAESAEAPQGAPPANSAHSGISVPTTKPKGTETDTIPKPPKVTDVAHLATSGTNEKRLGLRRARSGRTPASPEPAPTNTSSGTVPTAASAPPSATQIRQAVMDYAATAGEFTPDQATHALHFFENVKVGQACNRLERDGKLERVKRGTYRLADRAHG